MVKQDLPGEKKFPARIRMRRMEGKFYLRECRILKVNRGGVLNPKHERSNESEHPQARKGGKAGRIRDDRR
ncbi:hypothetical protein TNCV_672331 [Trichonephila clavipes]|nr:hypothetical protein TNCV_672331 [Trichonephila clavipes]